MNKIINKKLYKKNIFKILNLYNKKIYLKYIYKITKSLINYKLKIIHYDLGFTNYKTIIDNYESIIDKNKCKIYERRINNYKKIINNYKLKIDNYELNVTQNELNINENEIKKNNYIEKLEYSIDKIYSKKEYKLNTCEDKINNSVNLTNIIKNNLEECKSNNITNSLKIEEMNKNQTIMNKKQCNILKTIEEMEKINNSLNDENKHLKMKLEGINCCICYSRKPNIVFTSCKHLVICSQCEIANRRITQLRKCPICRKDYTAILKIHN